VFTARSLPPGRTDTVKAGVAVDGGSTRGTHGTRRSRTDIISLDDLFTQRAAETTSTVAEEVVR